MITNRATAIVHYLQQQAPEMTAFLKKLTEVESPSTVKNSQEEVMSFLAKALSDIDYPSQRRPGQKTGGFLYAKPRQRKRGQPVQLLLGHCDTVWPLNTLQSMPVEVEEEKMRGPGVYDMKGGLTQLLFALRCIRELSLRCPVTPLVLINADEEIGSHESTATIRRLAKIADRALVLEPSLGLSGKIKTARKGVGRFTITVRGKAAHAGLDPTKGVSSIVVLSHTIQELFAMNDPSRGISVNVGMVSGGVRANVVAPESTAVVDVRVPTQQDADEITRRIHDLQSTHPEAKLTVEGHIGRLPMEVTPRNSQLWEVAQSAGEALGISLEHGMAGGGSDANTTSQYTATLDGLGAVGDGAHATHEFVYLDKMVERTALLTLLLVAPPLE
jgi:glutamate carboxypeptidase